MIAVSPQSSTSFLTIIIIVAQILRNCWIIVYTFNVDSDSEDEEYIAVTHLTSSYAKGSLSCSDKNWFHGELTREKAEQALAASGCDCFLIRQSQGALVLSLIQHGELHHIKIEYRPGGYELEDGSAQCRFLELEDLVSYYSAYAIGRDLNIRLTKACERTNGMKQHTGKS